MDRGLVFCLEVTVEVKNEKHTAFLFTRLMDWSGVDYYV